MPALPFHNLSSAGGRFSRRHFLRSSALTAAITAIGGPHVLSDRNPNRRLNIGAIGVGGKGGDNLHKVATENIVALCDVDEHALDRAARRFPHAIRYRDFRRMLERTDLDAVVISTPDHTHAVATMHAIQLGKHVYCEKPLTRTIDEARRIAIAAREKGVATQMGNGGHSSDGTIQLVEWIRAGVIGEIREVHAWSNRPTWPQGLIRPADIQQPPSHVAWDLWLGPAPKRPWHSGYHPFKWRGWWDFGTGALGDMGCHILDGAFWALELGQPSAVDSISFGATNDSPPLWSIVHYAFNSAENRPPVSVTWYDGGKQPAPALAGLNSDYRFPANGSLFVGKHASILMEHGGRPRLVPEILTRDFVEPARTLPRSTGHHREWIEACKGGKPAGANFDYAGPLTEFVLLGNVALRAEKRIDWDAVSMTARNAPEVADFVHSEYREGWAES